MPTSSKAGKAGKAGKVDLPGTIRRSPKKAQRTCAETTKQLGVDRRSRMSKLALVQAIARRQD